MPGKEIKCSAKLPSPLSGDKSTADGQTGVRRIVSFCLFPTVELSTTSCSFTVLRVARKPVWARGVVHHCVIDRITVGISTLLPRLQFQQRTGGVHCRRCQVIAIIIIIFSFIFLAFESAVFNIIHIL